MTPEERRYEKARMLALESGKRRRDAWRKKEQEARDKLLDIQERIYEWDDKIATLLERDA